MPLTTVYKLPYPAAADPADVPLDMQELAEAVEQHGPGTELAYLTLAGFPAVTATSAATGTVIGTTSALTLDGTTRIAVELFLQHIVTPSAIGAFILINLFDTTTDLGIIGGVSTPAAATLGMAQFSRKILAAPSAGSHTYLLRAYVSTGTGSTQPGYLRVVRA